MILVRAAAAKNIKNAVAGINKENSTEDYRWFSVQTILEHDFRKNINDSMNNSDKEWILCYTIAYIL